MSRAKSLLAVLACLLVSSCKDPAILDLGGQHLHQPRERVEQAYRLAAEHGILLDRIPCFCGCESYNHKAVTSCFVRSRDANGGVTRWDYHGAKCALCIDVVLEAVRLQNEGRSPTDIRNLLETRYRHTGKKTHTPPIS